jgi:hypothetical protein
MAKLTRDALLERANAIWEQMLDDIAKAGVKREWNRFTGSVSSKNDILRAATADLRILNDVAKAHGWKAVYIDEEDKPVKVGKLAK